MTTPDDKTALADQRLRRIEALISDRDALRERIAALERHGYVVAMRLMQSEVRLDDAEQAGLDAFITKVAARAALGERK
jgi:hypothetical protein